TQLRLQGAWTRGFVLGQPANCARTFASVHLRTPSLFSGKVIRDHEWPLYLRHSLSGSSGSKKRSTWPWSGPFSASRAPTSNNVDQPQIRGPRLGSIPECPFCSCVSGCIANAGWMQRGAALRKTTAEGQRQLERDQPTDLHSAIR